MKRRIIAALTALVMVVTMIPASAFAATNTAEYVDKLIEYAVYVKNPAGDTNVVELADKAKLDDAKKAYDSLGSEQIKDVKNADVMFAALNAFEKYQAALDEFAKATDVKAGTIDSTNKDSIKTAVEEAYTGITNINDGTVKGVAPGNVSVKVKLVLYTDTKEIKDLVGAENYGLYELVTNGGYGGMVAYINWIEDKYVTEDVLDGINATNYLTGNGSGNDSEKAVSYVVAAKSNATGNIFDIANARYIKNYDNFMKVDARIQEFVDLNKVITGTVKTTMDGANTVATVKVFDAKKLDEAKKAVEEASAVVAKYGTEIDPDFSGTLYANFVASYDKAKVVVEFVEGLSAFEKQIRELPTKETIEKASLSDTLKVYNDVVSYEQKLADVYAITSENATTVLGKELADKITNTKAYAVERLKDFEGQTVDTFAADLLAAINKLPATASVTRANVADVNAAVDVVLAYNALYSKSISVAKLPSEVKAKSDVFALANDAKKLSKTALDSEKTLKAALDKLDNNAWNRLVAASEVIVDQAKADKKAADDVAKIVKTVNVKFAGENGMLASGGSALETVTKENADKAQKVVDKYNAEYAKLNSYAKADFENAMKYSVDEYVLGTSTVAELAEKVQENINNTLPSLEVINKAFAVKDAITTLCNTVIAEIPANLESQRNQIAAIDKMLEDKAVATYFNVNFPDDKAKFDARKAEVAKYVSESAAVKAVINSIDALKVIDNNTVVDKASVEKAIADYEATLKTYNALTTDEKAAVTNASKLDAVKDGLKVGLVKVFDAEVAKIGNYTAGFTTAQIDQINSISAMIKAYGSESTVKYFNETTDAETSWAIYDAAAKALDKSIKDEAEKEVLAIKPFISQVVGYEKLTKNNAADYIKAVDLVNALSDEALEVFKDPTRGYKALYDSYVAKVLPQYKDAKALLLDYATVTVEDQEYTGEALTPAVVVKNSDGQVVDASQYTVAYSNNTKPGTATVIVTAKADATIGGSVQATFQIVAKELAKVENVKFDTDYGIVRVYFDRTADIEGIDVRYQVQYKKSTSSTWTTKYPTKGLDYLTLKSLTKNGKYDVRVRAYTDDYGTERVYGEYSDVQTVYANRNGAKSGIMYKAVINSLTTKNGSVTVKVKDVNYTSEPTDVTWKYSYKKYGTQYKTWSTWKSTKNTSYTFKNLKKGTRYVFRVQYTYTSAVDGKTAVNSNYSVYKNIVVK